MKNLSISKNGRWLLRLVVPNDVRSAIGKYEFKKSLGHLTRQEAEIKAGILIAQWKSIILTERQRSGISQRTHNPDLSEYSDKREQYWKWAEQSLQTMAGIDEPSDEQITTFLQEQLEEHQDIVAPTAQISATFSPYCYTASFLDQYSKDKLRNLESRNKDEHINVLKNQFVPNFPVLDSKFTLRKVESWWDKVNDPDPAKRKAPSTIRKYRSHCRAYMNWLIRKGYTSIPNYFDQLEQISKKDIAKDQRKRGTARKPFSDNDLATIWQNLTLRKNQDTGLNELFLIAVYTGCRIEEICNLTSKDLRQTASGRFYIDIPISKTEKGTNRSVPLHSVLEKVVVGKVGYLVDVGKVNNRYGERSSAIGKKFGRLKDSIGFGKDKVFHSIRKSFTDKLKLAGTPELFAADILGHEIKTMSYGVYASAAPVETLIPYIDNVSYPELEKLL